MVKTESEKNASKIVIGGIGPIISVPFKKQQSDNFTQRFTRCLEVRKLGERLGLGVRVLLTSTSVTFCVY